MESLKYEKMKVFPSNLPENSLSSLFKCLLSQLSHYNLAFHLLFYYFLILVMTKWVRHSQVIDKLSSRFFVSLLIFTILDQRRQ
jgi:hypothetical protein